MADSSSPPPPARRITGFESIPRSPARVRVRFDDGSTLDVPRETVAEAGLAKGDPVDDALRARLAHADLLWGAREAALSLLSHRARSRSELAGRLRRKDIPGPVIRDCLDELEERGIVDDAEFARALARDRIRLKPRARTAILRELRSKGVADSVARDAVDEIFREEEVSEEELAVDVAFGWLRRQGPQVRDAFLEPPFSDPREQARRRLTGYLSRRGFRGARLVAAVEAVENRVTEVPS